MEWLNLLHLCGEVLPFYRFAKPFSGMGVKWQHFLLDLLQNTFFILFSNIFFVLFSSNFHSFSFHSTQNSIMGQMAALFHRMATLTSIMQNRCVSSCFNLSHYVPSCYHSILLKIALWVKWQHLYVEWLHSAEECCH